MNETTTGKLVQYLDIIKNILAKAKIAPENLNIKDSTKQDFIDVIERYLSNAENLHGNGDLRNAFASLNYAQGWLDAAVKLGIFDIDKDKTLKLLFDR